MDVEHYRQQLLRLRTELAARLKRAESRVQTQVPDAPDDAGDASALDEVASEAASEAERDAALLTRIDDALVRIADGRYGRCLVDGGQIETTRLDAVPWAEYCVRHQRLVESASPPKPTM